MHTSLPTPARGGCTVIYAADDRVALAGSNEDAVNPYTYVWFVPAAPGEYGRVYFGFEDGIPQGWVNEAGLLFDGLALRPKSGALSRSQAGLRRGHPPEHPVGRGHGRGCHRDRGAGHPGHLQPPGMDTYQLLFGDAGGESAIVDGADVRRRTGSFELATNFRLS